MAHRLELSDLRQRRQARAAQPRGKVSERRGWGLLRPLIPRTATLTRILEDDFFTGRHSGSSRPSAWRSGGTHVLQRVGERAAVAIDVGTGLGLGGAHE